MIVACPKCETTFALPDGLYKPGRKARCSHCGNVFPMPELEPDFSDDPAPGIGIAAPAAFSPPEPAAPVRKKHTLIIALVLLICFVGIGYGGYMIYRSVTASDLAAAPPADLGQKNAASEEEARKRAAFEALVRGIDLGKPQQFVVDNDKLGRMVVIQGMAVNRLDKPVDFITVETKLQDKDKRTLATVRQVCGATLTLFQLQLLSEQELQAALNNKVVIYTYNVKVPPGGSVPFIVVFPRLPDDMANYEVRVIDVRESSGQQPQ